MTVVSNANGFDYSREVAEASEKLTSPDKTSRIYALSIVSSVFSATNHPKDIRGMFAQVGLCALTDADADVRCLALKAIAHNVASRPDATRKAVPVAAVLFSANNTNEQPEVRIAAFECLHAMSVAWGQFP